MWRAVSSRRDTSDPEFVVWIIDAESEDGQFRVVKVKIDAYTVDDGPWLTGDGSLRQVREALETQGRSLVESMRDRPELPKSIVYRSEAGEFVEE
jgi:hypothetical protein